MKNDFNKNIGEKIRQLRNRLNLSQQDFAEQVGISSFQTISDIEKGERELKAYELATFARVLRVNTNELLTQEKIIEKAYVLWRDEPTDFHLKEANFIKHCENYFKLEQFCNCVIHIELPQKKVDFETIDYDEAELLADEILNKLNLGSSPAENLENVLERNYNVKIFYDDLGIEGSAASTKNKFGSAILMNKNEAPWRRNFSFGHELFHLITWESIPAIYKIERPERWKKIEKIANVFASNLLLPEMQVNYAFKKCIHADKIKYIDLIQIAREFGVSSEALIYRLCNLGRITKVHVKEVLNDEKFRELDRNSMRGQWWTRPELPERFVRLAFKAYQEAKISRTFMAEYLNQSLLNLKNFLEGYSLYEGDNKSYETEMYIA